MSDRSVLREEGGGAVLVGSAIPRGSTRRVGVLVGLRGNGSLDPRFAGGGVHTFHVGDSTSGCASATGDARHGERPFTEPPQLNLSKFGRSELGAIVSPL